MAERGYFSRRRGFVSGTADLQALREVVRALLRDFEREGYFQKHLGFECVDAGFEPGSFGSDVSTMTRFVTGVDFWPLEIKVVGLAEHELFTALEFLHDHAAKPTSHSFHDWGECGIHVNSADDSAGGADFRRRLNPLLAAYGTGYEVQETGEIWELSLVDLGDLEPVLIDEPAVDDRVQAAIAAFRRYGSDEDDKRRQCVISRMSSSTSGPPSGPSSRRRTKESFSR